MDTFSLNLIAFQKLVIIVMMMIIILMILCKKQTTEQLNYDTNLHTCDNSHDVVEFVAKTGVLFRFMKMFIAFWVHSKAHLGWRGHFAILVSALFSYSIIMFVLITTSTTQDK